ncbi:hypothetical protein VTN77DRAFT_9579 [Rasamsonia byssochlamydoides]|uniref:uncharacterized protein n=1 Tax=Rasamsonia byssochlamydoides TaxID=89139 RepID=UPI0037434046
MRYATAATAAALLATLSAHVAAHGVVTQIQGANGVNMPGLSVIDGTPRNCATPLCGAEADTSIIRQDELGTDRASALGRTEGGGPVDAARVISAFMGTSSSSAGNGNKRGLLGSLLGGSDGSQNAGTKSSGVETGIQDTAGKGAQSGIPTCSDNGTISMTFHQVNQDGAGPLTAMIDPTSGGTDPNAFQQAEVTQDVPGDALGLSLVTTTDFPIQVQMPEGMTCQGSVGGVSNVCIVRVHNNALAGPFGGSAAFTQSSAARKRAVEYNLRKRHMARGVLRQ